MFPPPSQEHRESALFWWIFPSPSINFSLKIAKQGPLKRDPDGRFVTGCFVPMDVLSPRTFCPHGCFVPTDVLSARCYVTGRFVLPDILSAECFVRTDVSSCRTFCPAGRFVPSDVLSTDVLSPDVLSPDILSGHLTFQSVALKIIFSSQEFNFTGQLQLNSRQF
jgi:hypothetical protein